MYKKMWLFINRIECRIARAWTKRAHKRLRHTQWALPPQPEHFDHAIDLFYQWDEWGRPYWLERGNFGNFALQHLMKRRGEEITILDLCCGDAFYSKFFYNYGAKSILAVDFDPEALATARAKNATDKIEFLQADIREGLPGGKFDLIIWDAAFEHFTEEELAKIIGDIKNALNEDGILCSYTIKAREGVWHLEHHEYEPASLEDFMSFFKKYFKHIEGFETNYDERDNLYLMATDHSLPMRGW